MEIDPYRADAERALKKGLVREIDFSNATYQLEIYDPEYKESFWPFLQFDCHQIVQDAFCSCPSKDERGCVHLAIAYLKIFDGYDKPLHLRFEHSFWNALCSFSADHIGYEKRFLEKKEEGHYQFNNEITFSVQAKGIRAQNLLKGWIEKRIRETPENSIRFSNLSQEEINWWREGRPSPTLRYALSFWSDLAKWAFIHQDKGTIQFQEDEEGFPTNLKIFFPEFFLIWRLPLVDLEALIPTLTTVKSPLIPFRASRKKIQSIKYDVKNQVFKIEHTLEQTQENRGITKQIGKWTYYPKVGFSHQDESLLSHNCIELNQMSEFLENDADTIRSFIPVAQKRVKLSYAMHFDRDWNWHFSAFVFEKGDLQQADAKLFENWAYLPDKGFYPVEDILFERIQRIFAPEEVSHFVNHHRIWLNGQEGFQTHLASIESHLTYSVTKEGSLCFHAKTHGESMDSHDFGDWIYYSTQGFFSKKHARLGLVVRPGVEISRKQVSRFIKKNQEELEHIPHFFTTRLPINECGLEILVKSESAIHVKPVYKGEERIQFFGDYVFKEGEGFCELPPHMRLLDGYKEEKIIGQEDLETFLINDLPQLKKYILRMDALLTPPLKSNLEVHYLVRKGLGRLKAQLVFRTEQGIIPISLVADGYKKKRRYLFTEGGLLDLRDQHYQWVRPLINRIHPELQMVELTTLEFMRLDATFSILGPSDELPLAEFTRKLLRELREFSSHEQANTEGLHSELRLYQQTGLQWLWFLYKNGLSALLCDDMGLGKTHQAMALIAATLNQKHHDKKQFLVVCPTSVIYHWQDKLATFLPNVKVYTFHGLKRSLKNLPREKVILTTYGIMRMEKKSLANMLFEIAIFDEIQVAKNPTSRVHKALTHIQAHMRVGLTGTPIENNLRELKSLFDIVLPGYMPAEARYRELFLHPIERDFDKEKKNLLSQIIRPFVLRRCKSEVLQELPEKSEDKSYCDLSEEQYKLYREVISKDRDQLILQLRDQKAKVNFLHVFAMLSRLKQVCNHPALVHQDPKNYKRYQSGKWDLFVELLEETRESDQKVVVFSQYLCMLDIMKNYLRERGWGYAHIRGDTVDRREELKRFQEDPSCVVFIGSLQAAGLGIDLTAASVVIMFDRWWNAARENQAIDRVHRIGQKRGVQVYKLITKGTIEEKIDRMITKKGQLLKEIVISDDQTVLKKFSRSELIDLLSYQKKL